MNASALPNAVRSRLRARLLHSQAEPAQGLSSVFTESLGMPKAETPGTSCSHHGERQEPGMKSCGTQSPSWIAHGRVARAVVQGGARAHLSQVWGRALVQARQAALLLPTAGSTSFYTNNWPCRYGEMTKQKDFYIALRPPIFQCSVRAVYMVVLLCLVYAPKSSRRQMT